MIRCKVFIIFTFSIIAQLIGGIGLPVADAGSEYYFFNPDSSQSNLGNLKREMDTLFSKAGLSITFQAFAHQIDFDRKLGENRSSFLFLPNWYLKLKKDELSIKPLLSPTRRGGSTYIKVLLASKRSNFGLDSLKSRSLAMTSFGPNGEAILNEIIFSNHGVDAKDISIVVVPKDSDALFALALGQVDMALVVKDNMEQIAAMLPKIMQAVRTLGETGPIPMPVLCYADGVAMPEQVEKIKALFLDSDKKEMRHKIMELLQVDEWQTYTE